MKIFNVFSCLFIVAFFFVLPAEAEEVMTLDTAYGGKLDIIFLKPDNPKAAVILFPGGRGYLKLDNDRFMRKQKKRFLVGNRAGFMEKGLMVAVVNAPEGIKDLRRTYRMSDKHSQDIQAVIKFLKTKAKVSIWLVGHSRGTFSAANGAIRLGDQVNGLVLTSTITKSREKYAIYKTHPNAVLDMSIGNVKVPTLVLANKPDSCFSSPASNAHKVVKALAGSPAAAVKMYGDKDPGDATCKSGSPHHFANFHDEVEAAIVAFIEAQTK